MGNLTLELDWRDSENLLLSVITSAPADGEVVFLEATGLTNTATTADTSARAHPFDFRGLVRKAGSQYEIVDDLAVITDTNGDSVDVTDIEVGDYGLEAAGLVNDGSTSVTFTKVTARRPSSVLADGTRLCSR